MMPIGLYYDACMGTCLQHDWVILSLAVALSVSAAHALWLLLHSLISSTTNLCTHLPRTLSVQTCASIDQSPGRCIRFGDAIRAGRISKVEQIEDCCVLAAVGHQMASRKGVAATMFSALAKANINIR